MGFARTFLYCLQTYFYIFSSVLEPSFIKWSLQSPMLNLVSGEKGYWVTGFPSIRNISATVLHLLLNFLPFSTSLYVFTPSFDGLTLLRCHLGVARPCSFGLNRKKKLTTHCKWCTMCTYGFKSSGTRTRSTSEPRRFDSSYEATLAFPKVYLCFENHFLRTLCKWPWLQLAHFVFQNILISFILFQASLKPHYF